VRERYSYEGRLGRCTPQQLSQAPLPLYEWHSSEIPAPEPKQIERNKVLRGAATQEVIELRLAVRLDKMERALNVP